MKPRLTAAITGRGREVGPIEAHEKTVLAAAAKVARLQRRLRQLVAEQKRARTALRAARREFRVLLQRDPDATLEQLDAAGKADGADRAQAIAEAGVWGRAQAIARELADQHPLPACDETNPNDESSELDWLASGEK